MTEPPATTSVPQNPPGQGVNAGKHPIAAHPLASAIIAVLVGGAIICTLVVPIYGSITPKVGSWPFFYAYLLAFMPAVAIALWIAMLLQRRLGRGDASANAEAAQ